MSHFGIVDENLNVLVFGKNNQGQLGLDDRDDRKIPAKVQNLESIISSSTTNNHSLFLDDRGSVWSCGTLAWLCPSIGIPKQIENINNIVKIASGNDYYLFLDNLGDVFSLGSYDVWGLKDKNSTEIPTKIEDAASETLPKIRDIGCGKFHSILIDIDGNCWSIGANHQGQLGLGDRKNRVLPTKMLFTGENKNVPCIQSVSAGFAHTILVDIEGNVYSCGSDGRGYFQGYEFIHEVYSYPKQINGLPSIKFSHCGNNFTILIDIDDNTWAFGNNRFGQLGFGHNEHVGIPTQIPFNNGRICSVICSVDSTIIINSEGQCFSCGNNEFGQLGLGHTNDINVPTKIEGLKAFVKNDRFKTTKSSRKCI